MATIVLMLDAFVRSALLVLSVISFVPQLSKIRSRSDCEGISLLYILFNLCAATNHFALVLNFIAFHWEGGFPDRPPRTICDWLDVGQFTVVWLCQTMIFTLLLRLPPRRPAQKTLGTAAYLALITVTLIPTITGVFIQGSEEDKDWFVGTLEGVLLFIIEPLMQILSIAALFAQTWTTIRRGAVDALSIKGLVVQCVAFLLVGLSFIYRLRSPDGAWDEEPWVVVLREWYWLIGWATVGNLLFAFVQGVLAWVAWRQGKTSGEELDECEPLLSQ